MLGLGGPGDRVLAAQDAGERLPLCVQLEVAVPAGHVERGVTEQLLNQDRVGARRLGTSREQVSEGVNASELRAPNPLGQLEELAADPLFGDLAGRATERHHRLFLLPFAGARLYG